MVRAIGVIIFLVLACTALSWATGVLFLLPLIDIGAGGVAVRAEP